MQLINNAFLQLEECQGSVKIIKTIRIYYKEYKSGSEILIFLKEMSSVVFNLGKDGLHLTEKLRLKIRYSFSLFDRT